MNRLAVIYYAIVEPHLAANLNGRLTHKQLAEAKTTVILFKPNTATYIIQQ